MKITTKNYLKIYKELNPKLISDTIEKVHQYILKNTKDGTNWEVLQKAGNAKSVVENQFKEVETLHKQSLTKSKGVENLGDAQRLIKRFVSFEGKVKKIKELLPLLRSLQQAMLKKLIRKTSPLANLVEGMQDQLLEYCNKYKPSQEVKVSVRNLNEYVVAAGGETVYKSIFLIRRFIDLSTASKMAGVAEYRKLLVAFEKAKINADDPYQGKIKDLQKIVKLRAENKDAEIPAQDLKGLHGIAELGTLYRKPNEYTRPCKDRKRHSDADAGACSWHRGLRGIDSQVEDAPVSKAIPLYQIAQKHYDTMGFTGLWKQLFGKPCRFKMMIHGESGSGKSVLMLRFAHYLATQFGPVLYVSTEEHDSPTMQIKASDLPDIPGDLKTLDSLEGEDLGNYKFVIVDSVNHMKLSLERFKQLVKEYANTSFILIFQHTKDGQYRGSNDWIHEMDIAALVDKHNVKVHKNRYGVYGEANFYNPLLINRNN